MPFLSTFRVKNVHMEVGGGQKGAKLGPHSTYCTRAIITRGLCTFYPLFEFQKRFLRSFFLKFLTVNRIGDSDMKTVFNVWV